MEQKSLISLIVKNEKGVLAKISDLLGKANINIEKLVVSTIDVEGTVSKIIFYLTGNRETVNDFFEKNIKTLPAVLKINNFVANGGFVEKELLIIKISQTNINFTEINSIVSSNDGKIIFIDEHIVIYQIISDSDKIDESVKKILFLTKEVEISRSGIVAMDFNKKLDDFTI